LKKGFRQNDSRFLKILNELRQGHVSENTKHILCEKVKEYHRNKAQNSVNSEAKRDLNSVLLSAAASSSSSIDAAKKIKVVPTVLYSNNKNVDEINTTALSKIKLASYYYESIDEGSEKSRLKDLRAPEILELKVGCQVLLLKNLNTRLGLVNGAKGVVTSFVSTIDMDERHHKYIPVVDFEVNMGRGLIEKHTESINLADFEVKAG
jgi:hypothetical protein